MEKKNNNSVSEFVFSGIGSGGENEEIVCLFSFVNRTHTGCVCVITAITRNYTTPAHVDTWGRAAHWRIGEYIFVNFLLQFLLYVLAKKETLGKGNSVENQSESPGFSLSHHFEVYTSALQNYPGVRGYLGNRWEKTLWTHTEIIFFYF